MRIYIQEKDDQTREPLQKYRYHINVDFFDALKPVNSIGVLKLQIRSLIKTGEKEMFLSAVNWTTSQRCSTEGNIKKFLKNKKINSELVLSRDTAGQLNVVLDGKKVDLECLVGPWSHPVKIKVTGLDMKASKTKVEDLFEIHYKIDQATSEYDDVGR